MLFEMLMKVRNNCMQYGRCILSAYLWRGNFSEEHRFSGFTEVLGTKNSWNKLLIRRLLGWSSQNLLIMEHLILGRHCPDDCIFSPYFPSSDPQLFSIVHSVFGADKVEKRLQELPVDQRADAVKS